MLSRQKACHLSPTNQGARMKPSHRRADREHHQGPGHHQRRLMRVRVLLDRHVRLAEEHQIQLAEDVDAGEIRGDDSGNVAVGAEAVAGRIGCMQHRVVRLRAGEWPQPA